MTGGRFPWALYIVLFALLLAFTLAPVASVIFASVLANANGCTLDEGSIHPCLVGGADWGGTLYDGFVLGWLLVITLPLGSIALLAAAIVLLIHRGVWVKRHKAPTS